MKTWKSNGLRGVCLETYLLQWGHVDEDVEETGL